MTQRRANETKKKPATKASSSSQARRNERGATTKARRARTSAVQAASPSKKMPSSTQGQAKPKPKTTASRKKAATQSTTRAKSKTISANRSAQGKSSTRNRATTKRTTKQKRTPLAAAHDTISAVGTLIGHYSKRAVLAFVVALVLAVGAIGTAVTTEARIQADLDGLPSYITEDMVSEARSMQAHYGHPAGCTIAQIIAESSYQGGLSQLAKEDHNLFGMKWANSFAGCDGVVGPANWDTNEEYDGELVQINDAFIEFKSDKACIKFRSAVFLQASTYADNALIQQAIAERSSTLMAQGLQDAGWATDSTYANKLIAIMDQYDLYRFDI